MLRTPFLRSTCRLLLVLTWIVSGITIEAGRGVGQYIYRWTDEKGGVHFTQSPPPHGEQFEVRDLPAPASAPAPTTEATPVGPEMTRTGGQDATPGGTPTPKREGLARVELGKQSAQVLEPSTRLFKGTVENAGGVEARNVVVRITVTETQQGAECLQTEIDVTPSSLRPGATGTYEAEFDNPCFLDNVSIQMEPSWD